MADIWVKFRVRSKKKTRHRHHSEAVSTSYLMLRRSVTQLPAHSCATSAALWPSGVNKMLSASTVYTHECYHGCCLSYPSQADGMITLVDQPKHDTLVCQLFGPKLKCKANLHFDTIYVPKNETSVYKMRQFMQWMIRYRHLWQEGKKIRGSSGLR